MLVYAILCLGWGYSEMERVLGMLGMRHVNESTSEEENEKQTPAEGHILQPWSPLTSHKTLDACKSQIRKPFSQNVS